MGTYLVPLYAGISQLAEESDLESENSVVSSTTTSTSLRAHMFRVSTVYLIAEKYSADLLKRKYKQTTRYGVTISSD